MKKVTVGAIAVLFLLVSFGYTSAQQNNLNTNMAGELTPLVLQITHEGELPAAPPLLEGQAFATLRSTIGELLGPVEQKLLRYNSLFDPILYMWVDANGNLLQMNISWLDPNPSSSNHGTKIWTISCTGGNQTVPYSSLTANLPEIEDGTISNKPQVTNAAIARTDTVHGRLACYICPDGFQYTYNSGTPSVQPTFTNTVCNGGESWIIGNLSFTPIRS